jgi:hypothetical protein
MKQFQLDGTLFTRRILSENDKKLFGVQVTPADPANSFAGNRI